ncbi:MAG: hypothetical protein AB7F76_15600, partial [Parvibaculaceae bacterium]
IGRLGDALLLAHSDKELKREEIETHVANSLPRFLPVCRAFVRIFVRADEAIIHRRSRRARSK